MYLRDIRKPLELSDDDIQKLIRKIEEISGITFNDKFADTINNCIGILREKFLIEKHAKRNKAIKRELTRLRNALNKVLEIQDAPFSDHAHMTLIDALQDGYDSLNAANNHIEYFLIACDEAIEKVSQREKSKEHTFTATKQAMATELARELASFGIEITAYRDGVFSRCLREFFKAFNGETGNQSFRMSVAEDLFDVVKKAKEDHVNPERFIMLKIR